MCLLTLERKQLEAGTGSVLILEISPALAHRFPMNVYLTLNELFTHLSYSVLAERAAAIGD